jgi:hypothetical protein
MIDCVGGPIGIFQCLLGFFVLGIISLLADPAGLRHVIDRRPLLLFCVLMIIWTLWMISEGIYSPTPPPECVNNIVIP